MGRMQLIYIHKQTTCGCVVVSVVLCVVVSVCGSVRCKTCKHISQGSTFISNGTKRWYSFVSPNPSMNCTSDNVVYLRVGSVEFSMLVKPVSN